VRIGTAQRSVEELTAAHSAIIGSIATTVRYGSRLDREPFHDPTFSVVREHVPAGWPSSLGHANARWSVVEGDDKLDLIELDGRCVSIWGPSWERRFARGLREPLTLAAWLKVPARAGHRRRSACDRERSRCDEASSIERADPCDSRLPFGWPACSAECRDGLKARR
jgi:hypothetical protein